MFPFVPRKVAQRSHHPGPSSPSSSSRPPVAGPSSPALVPRTASLPDAAAADKKGKGKSTGSTLKDEDLAALLCLSLSDHALWLDIDLRRTVASADDGWIPLSHLLSHSSYLLHLNVPPAEAALVRAARAHATDALEVRMLVSAPDRSAWYGRDAQDRASGYEVRRTDLDDALTRVRNSTRHEWDARTVYVEGIPPSHRSVPAISRFLSSLVGSPGAPSRIQAVSLPPHHLDRPGDTPKCKGFALVTFADTHDTEHIAAEWPWLPRRTVAPPDVAEGPVTQEAVKFGFRVVSKARWEELKEEYLAYRQQLLDEAAGVGPQAQAGASYAAPAYDDLEDVDTPNEPTPKPSEPARAPRLDPYAPFPPGCLVFVKNVHPETNKTTLKSLFAAHAAVAPDYVDYTKGMASCHLRLAAPAHAHTLAATFTSKPRVQTHGLDASASAAPEDTAGAAKPIHVEVVTGEREALYWERVPEKVRREAVRRAVALEGADGGEPGAVAAEDVGQGEGGEKRARKRKRRG